MKLVLKAIIRSLLSVQKIFAFIRKKIMQTDCVYTN